MAILVFPFLSYNLFIIFIVYMYTHTHIYIQALIILKNPVGSNNQNIQACKIKTVIEGGEEKKVQYLLSCCFELRFLLYPFCRREGRD